MQDLSCYQPDSSTKTPEWVSRQPEQSYLFIKVEIKQRSLESWTALELENRVGVGIAMLAAHQWSCWHIVPSYKMSGHIIGKKKLKARRIILWCVSLLSWCDPNWLHLCILGTALNTNIRQNTSVSHIKTNHDDSNLLQHFHIACILTESAFCSSHYCMYLPFLCLQ